MIRKVFRSDSAPDNSISAPDNSILPGVPERRSGGDRFVLWFLTCLAALLVVLPSCVGPSLGASLGPSLGPSLAASPATGAKDGPRQGVELAENAAPKTEAAEAWDAVKDTTNPALLEAFVKRYGSTFFAKIAKARLDQLKAAATKPSPAEAAKVIPTYPIHRDKEMPTDSFLQNPVQMPSDGVPQHAVLYDEDPSEGRQFVGSVVWRTELIKAKGKHDELAARADVDIPLRGLRMTMSLRRNFDPSLLASHVIELTFRLPAGFDGGGVANVPGILTKSGEREPGVQLAALAVKLTSDVFLVGLSNFAPGRRHNMEQLLRPWFDIPIVYGNQRRAILAIEKGESGEAVFKTVFAAWGQYPDATQPAAANPGLDSGKAGAR